MIPLFIRHEIVNEVAELQLSVVGIPPFHGGEDIREARDNDFDTSLGRTPCVI